MKIRLHLTTLFILINTIVFAVNKTKTQKVQNNNTVFSFNTLQELSQHDLYQVKDGDIAYVKGFRNKYDGGGGVFIYEEASVLEPVYLSRKDGKKIGYNRLFDGMIVKPANNKAQGRWLRQWDRGKLNVRWFGAEPESMDCSVAFNAALSYAQFERETKSNKLFNAQGITSAGKTIFIPSGRYFFTKELIDITHGVVFEGEGASGSTMKVGTTLVINYEKSDDFHGFIRYVSHKTYNTGGGLRNLNIHVLNKKFDANVVTIFSHDLNDVSHWTADNLRISCRSIARRAFYASSFDESGEGTDQWNIRVINLNNCFFSGATMRGNTVKINNVANFYMTGGFYYSGKSIGVESGILITGDIGCNNFVLTGISIQLITITKANGGYINCRYTDLIPTKRQVHGVMYAKTKKLK